MLTLRGKREVSLSADQVYDCLLDFFTNHPLMRKKRVEIMSLSKPSHIIMDVTPPRLWITGRVKVNILPKNGKSEIELIFDFRRFYFTWWLVHALLTAIFLIPTRFLILAATLLGFPLGFVGGDAEKKDFMDRIDGFLREVELLVGAGLDYKEAVVRIMESLPAGRKGAVYEKPERLYERLLELHTTFYGGGKTVLENRISSLTKRGLSREEAIARLARDLGING